MEDPNQIVINVQAVAMKDGLLKQQTDQNRQLNMAAKPNQAYYRDQAKAESPALGPSKYIGSLVTRGNNLKQAE